MTLKCSVVAIQKISSFIFHLLGLLLASYFIAKQIIQYYKNDDKSTVSMRRYHTTPEDKYPTFSICFTANPRYPDTLYQEEIVKATLGIDARDYKSALSGSSKQHVNFSILEYDEAKWDLLLILRSYSVYNKKERVLNYWDDDHINSTDTPFFQGYQDPGQLCITRKNEFYSGEII